MNLRFLRTFVEIADHAGFARAATRLNLTQSAASRQIQALEDELGLRLFTRAGRSVRLTSEGEDLLIRSRRLLFDADAIGQRASALKTGEVGVLRVGATPQVIENLLADFLLSYRKRHGGVEVHLVEDGGSRLPGHLERGDVNVALMPADESRFSGRILYPMHVLAVFPSGHRLSRRKVLEVVELANERCCVSPRALPRTAGSRPPAMSRTFGRACCSKASRRRRSSHWPEPATALLCFPRQ
jgi:DNA-binding transcriptional LysR family regulator